MLRALCDSGPIIDVPSVPVLITVLSVRDEDELYPTAICTIRILAVPCMNGLLQFFSHSHLHYIHNLISKTDNKGHDKPVHLRVLVMAFVVHAIYGVPHDRELMFDEKLLKQLYRWT